MDDAHELTGRSADPHSQPDRRLIEQWLPIAALSEESVRERRSLQALPPTYYLHVWWARRPLVASRAAVLASVLPENTDREKFMHVLGIHGDPVSVRHRLDKAKKTGENLGPNPYGYNRAFQHSPDAGDRTFIREALAVLGHTEMSVLDPTAGGGSIPMEATRLGLATFANDLNPVAALIEKATIEYPLKHGASLLPAFEHLAADFIRLATPKFQGIYPPELPDTQVVGYLWARTIHCPYCDGLIPLSPNWKLAPDGTGVHLRPDLRSGPHSGGRVCTFEIVGSIREQSAGTVADGDSTCPFSDCGRIVDGDEIKRQAQAGSMGEQLFTVVFKHRTETRNKAGNRGRDKWERSYRAPRPDDDNSTAIAERLAERLAEWDALDIVPNERLPLGNKTMEPIRYGLSRWQDMFSPRQLLGHGAGVEVFHELLAEREAVSLLDDVTKAAIVYLGYALRVRSARPSI
jgi:putative DNA methylase